MLNRCTFTSVSYTHLDVYKRQPVPISFEDIPGGAKGFFSPVESRIPIQERCV